jgi:hypothetical protein
MKIIGKEQISKKVIASELVGFAIVLAVIWLDELIDIPYLVLGAEITSVNRDSRQFTEVIYD